MTFKDLRDYLNGLDLNEVSNDVVIVSCTKCFQSGAEETAVQCDGLGDCLLDFSSEKPMLYIYTDECIDFLNNDCGD